MVDYSIVHHFFMTKSQLQADSFTLHFAFFISSNYDIRRLFVNIVAKSG
jgi:hypothetical protein